MKTIKNKISETKLVDWRKLEWLQPKDFKNDNPEIIEKLKTSLKNNGFASPFHVWQNKTKTYILDGHYRSKCLKELQSEGIKIPDKLPANFIDCKNKTEAKKMVLVYNSHYATINEDSMTDFLNGMNIDDLDLEINIPDIDLKIGEWEPKDNEKEFDENIETQNECPKCKYKW